MDDSNATKPKIVTTRALEPPSTSRHVPTSMGKHVSLCNPARCQSVEPRKGGRVNQSFAGRTTGDLPSLGEA